MVVSLSVSKMTGVRTGDTSNVKLRLKLSVPSENWKSNGTLARYGSLVVRGQSRNG